jgi:hypothetical protein
LRDDRKDQALQSHAFSSGADPSEQNCANTKRPLGMPARDNTSADVYGMPTLSHYYDFFHAALPRGKCSIFAVHLCVIGMKNEAVNVEVSAVLKSQSYHTYML